MNPLAREGYVPPSSHDFRFTPIFGDSIIFTKPVIQIFLAVLIATVFLIASSRKAAVVPSRLQYAGESLYGFVRKNLGEDVIGHDFLKFMPLLFSLFCFILVNNIFGVVPFLQFPTMSHIGFPTALALIVLVTYHYVGFKKHGAASWLKSIAFMPGMPKAIYLILTPIEVMTFFITRPLTLALRLFANMFAGHLLLLVFTTGGHYLLGGGLLTKLMSPFAFSMALGLTFFELGIEALQAYIFTLLTALYIAGALADEH